MGMQEVRNGSVSEPYNPCHDIQMANPPFIPELHMRRKGAFSSSLGPEMAAYPHGSRHSHTHGPSIVPTSPAVAAGRECACGGFKASRTIKEYCGALARPTRM